MIVLANQSALLGQEDVIKMQLLILALMREKEFSLKNGVLSQNEAHCDCAFCGHLYIDAPISNEVILEVNMSAFEKLTVKKDKHKRLKALGNPTNAHALVRPKENMGIIYATVHNFSHKARI